ncbi:MAG: triphosphoribosyl-dephospho-CoA synthase [Nitrososphaerota archaeon]|nr:triphosphoribosyl-dephospho-CoA synthase [Candidatus Bathyarchaeota archaeon]MDW8062477.1 triphosphoribosyl-dephospho-CoA synthase [Nitrososphaerota archaeon]
MKRLVEYIRRCAELASALEVSGWPKPGNVHRVRDRSGTRFEHFIAGSIALGSVIGDAALKGVMAAKGRLDLSRIGVGRLVRRAVMDIMSSHYGGNTHLGICLLFIPLSIASAKTYVEGYGFEEYALRMNIDSVIRSTTPIDAVNIYKAIAMANPPSRMGRVRYGRSPDLYDRDAYAKILEGNITLYDVMLESSSYDSIARELVTGMEISFEYGFRYLIETFESSKDINTAIVHTFLRILSRFPDTFIARSVGLKFESDVRRAVEIGVRETLWVSIEAGRILDLGGLNTDEGRDALWRFDGKLHSLGREYNPGTTADLTASSLMIALLNGLKF